MILPPPSTSANSRKLLGKTWASPDPLGETNPNVVYSTNCISNQFIASTDGSASAPSYTFNSASTTGVYKSDSGTLGIAANGNLIATFNGFGIGAPYGADIGNGTDTGLKVGSGDLVYKIFVFPQTLTFSVSANSVFDQVISGITNLQEGDLVNLIPPSDLNAGVIFCSDFLIGFSIQKLLDKFTKCNGLLIT
jgi:hypothetical protein